MSRRSKSSSGSTKAASKASSGNDDPAQVKYAPVDMNQFEQVYMAANQEMETALPEPLDILLNASLWVAPTFFALSAVSYWWNSSAKPISKNKLSEVLTQVYQSWAYALTESSRQEQQVLQQYPDMEPEQKQQLVEYMRSQLLQQLGQAELAILQQANTNKDQVKASIKEYESDKQVVKLVNELNRMVSTVVPPPPLPAPWDEAAVLSLLSQLFELRLATMEESYRSLKLDQRPAGTPLTAQMAEDLNKVFNETLQRRLAEFYAGKAITAQFVQKLTRSISQAPGYIDLVATYKQEQVQRYAALGLEVKKH